eukprot:m.47844 g.47844  ORF g.47844 m.47844 type:complete len:350 (-) comp20597_c0_seq1:157-1206(-)
MEGKQIKCWATQSRGSKIESWEYSVPTTLDPSAVEVKISHCGICHSDLHQINDSWGVATFPLVPGHEIVGEVTSVGDTVKEFGIGDIVGIGVQRSCCGDCNQCNQAREHTCPKITKTYAGPSNDKGGFAQHIRYPAKWVFKIPVGMKREHAAPLLCAGITTYSPLKRWTSNRKTKPVVGVIGIGGLGHIALQFAANFEHVAEVVAISTSDNKKESAMGFGADRFINSNNENEIKAAVASIDVLLNTVSGVQDLDSYLSLLKTDGVLVCVGLPDKSKKVGLFMQSIVAREKIIVGSYLGPKQDYNEMLQFAASHNVQPAVKLFDIGQVNEALKELEENKLRFRAVLVMSD